MRMMLHLIIGIALWHMHIYYIVFEHIPESIILAKKLISLLTVSPVRYVKARSKKQNLLPL